MPHAAPFHQQLLAKLRGLILDRTFPPGAQFLTERDVAERYRTSRPTANKVLSSLVSEGLLEIRRGAGTFVRENLLDYDLERLVSFTDKALASRRQPGTRVIAFRKVALARLPPHAASALNARDGEAFLFIERLRLADERPVIFEQRYVPLKLCPRMKRADAAGSLYAYWTRRLKLRIAGADESIRAINLDARIASHLSLPEGRACLLVTATGFLDGGVPLWHEETIYNSEEYEFRNRLGALAPSRPASGHIRSHPRDLSSNLHHNDE
jgi:GntR family transcriptional regulator